MKMVMKEWESTFIPEMELANDETTQAIVHWLNEKKMLEIIELKNGLSIQTNSFIGTIVIGDLQLTITPKIKGVELMTLLNYAYSVKDLKIVNQADFQLDAFPFFDILIFQLYGYADQLVKRELVRGYVRKKEDLSSPKGRLDFNQLVREKHLQKTTLPSIYFERNEDHLLNQVLLAGLKLSIQMVQDDQLKKSLQRLCSQLEEYISPILLNRQRLQQADSHINRLSEHYRPIVEIITLLYQAQGLEIEGFDNPIHLNGFLFDMNVFFEAFVEKLIRDFVPYYSLREQFKLHETFHYAPGYNPKRRKSPTPRPDYALLKKNKVVKLADAKYKDLWENALPRDMLYQLAIYALSSGDNKSSTIIYPSQNDLASTQKININNPMTNDKMATVVLKPINLNKLANLLKQQDQNRGLLQEYMKSVLFLD
ncbi:McrC family protein [Alkalihalobacillus sp. BA299]|uniref:McrC family protein n=1 Tax=Alkalihalobacillus sp. BA299 TaxID=2815938 RepID=UPI001AD98182|nr:hypothetical protein [Alkalihalobacillus sp. BA299]